MIHEQVFNLFSRHFGTPDIKVLSPGRINLIGEHTDYNSGYVLPAAINREISFYLKKNNLNRYRLFSFNFNDSFETESLTINPVTKRWANYLLGVIDQFQEMGLQVPGFDCAFGGNIPTGAGLSSSAAIETGLAYAINQLFGFNIQKTQLAKMAQLAEHVYAGVHCGIMDQFAIVHGKAKSLIKLDCRSLKFEYIPFNSDELEIILVDSGVKHELASTEYNKRTEECNYGVALLNSYYKHVLTLRDVNHKMLSLHEPDFDPVVYKRCEYVLDENRRVKNAAKALQENNFDEFGALMYQSHLGLRDKYEVSCSEMDLLVEIASQTPGVLGTRMMGGGFGGCTINLVKKQSVENFMNAIKKTYRTPDNNEPELIRVTISEGVRIF